MNDDEINNALRPLRETRLPAERREAAFDRIRAEWQAGLVEKQRLHAPRQNRRWLWASAASVLVALFSGLAVWVSQNSDDPAIQVATISAVHGDGPFAIDAPIYSHQAISTGAGTLSIKLTSGLVVRAAPQSELMFDDAGHLNLEKGQLFVDSHAARVDDPLVVETTLGNIRHLGTQYLVEYDRQQLAVAVREGMIALQKPSAVKPIATAAAGEQLSVSISAPQTIERARVDATDERWKWIEVVPSPIDIDGARLDSFLQWYQRETGRRITLQNADPDTRLNGSIAGLTPDEALAAIAIAAELNVVHKNDSVLVSKP